MLNKNSFSPKMGNWWPKIEPFFQTLEPIYKKLQEDASFKKIICPSAKDTYKAFELTDYNNLKCVVVGMCPYHSLTKSNEIIADGIALSCSKTKELQPSLENWYIALEEEFDQDSDREPDLSYLCKEGVLMLNLALTTEHQKAGSHLSLWKPFMEKLFTEVISITGVPVLFLGKEAAYGKRWLAPMQWSFEISHPASAAYSRAKWSSEGVFKKIKTIVKNNNGVDLNWFNNDTPF